jgi:hypothetical protein
MTWRNLREELCDVLAETVSARVPLGSFQPNQSVHVERGGRTRFGARPERTTCRECKALFSQPRTGIVARYCSRSCRLRVWKRKRFGALTQELRAFRAAVSKCPCGKPARSTGRNSGSLATYCSARCRAKQQWHRTRCRECIYRGAKRCVPLVPKHKPWAKATIWRDGRAILSPAQREEACRMRANGSTGPVIGARFNISARYALKLTRAFAPERSPSPRKAWGSGPRGHGGALKVTPAQVDVARAMRATGASCKAIAAELGISRSHASRVTKGALG